ncbi:unnamed protein product [Heterobilharzia americana]|nr:unnamed protein product [Heterobilharzia americana]
MHFYLMLGLVPVLLLAFLVNVFVGPAELTDIPEDYEPRHWEYHKVYETTVGCYEEIRAAKKAKEEQIWFRKSQLEYGDYRGWYFVPVNPVGVNRSFKKLKDDEEAAQFVSR